MARPFLAQRAGLEVIHCDRCGDPLPAVEARESALATADMLRRGVGADEVVCPACYRDLT